VSKTLGMGSVSKRNNSFFIVVFPRLVLVGNRGDEEQRACR